MTQMIKEAIIDCKKLLTDEGFMSYCSFEAHEERPLIGLTVTDKNKIETVIGKLYLLKQARKIDSYELLAMFPGNIQIIPKL